MPSNHEQNIYYGLSINGTQVITGVTTDTGLTQNSDFLVPTEHAIKSYIDNKPSVSSLSGLTDVDETNPVTGQNLIYTGSVWVNSDDIIIINETLSKLIPSPSPLLSTRTISIPSIYSADAQGTGTYTSNITTITSPIASVSGIFSDGANGTLTAYLNSLPIGYITMNSALTSGNTYINGALSITEVDPYEGVAGKQGFWLSLFPVTITVQSALTASNTGQYYGLTHSTTGSVPNLTFYIDNPTTSTISNITYYTGGTIRYISGIPSLSTSSTFSVYYTVNSAVSYFYNSTRIATISSSYITSSINSPTPSPIPTLWSPVGFSAQTITISNNQYLSTGFVFSITPYNSAGVSGTINSHNTNMYIDTISVETGRITSGIGQYPLTGVGYIYDSTQSLISSANYISELQMVDNKWIYPVSNYSTYTTPTTGPNYSTATGIRYVTFVVGTITANSTLQITYNISNFTTFGTNNQTSAITINCLISGSSATNGWIDCNTPFQTGTFPTNNGDPAMVLASSSATVKQFTFGATTKTGKVYIRTGIPAGYPQTFGSISFAIIA